MFTNIDLMNICFKMDKIFLELFRAKLKTILNINLRKLVSQYGEVSVMFWVKIMQYNNV